MENGIHVGNTISLAEAAPPVTDAVVRVLAAIAEHRIDRETGIRALDVIGLTAQPSPVSISDCTIDGGDKPRTTYVYQGDEAGEQS
jgi:hypothetical protein